jgi:NADH dehydrogenase (ubiquinone) 1 beta subcomplex subunit 8
MLSRRIASARPLARVVRHAARPALIQTRTITQGELEELNDPGQNGGYINPPPLKRQFRDPYGDWWDKQERRNYGEPVHEDNDILGIFTPEEYTHFTPGHGLMLLGCFVASVFALSGVVSFIYPDKVSVPRTFPGGLEEELGGPRAVRTRKEGDEPFPNK